MNRTKTGIQYCIPRICAKGKLICFCALLFAAVLFPSIPTFSQNSVWAWGSNGAQELGDFGWDSFSMHPIWVFDLADAIAISGGTSHSVALKEDGSVWDWGYCLSGGHTPCWSTPREVPELSDIVGIAAGGENFSLALRSDGTVWQWDIESPMNPAQVSGLNNVIAITAGCAHSLALKNDGTVWAWGDNYYGQLGDGTNEDKTIPVQVLGITDVIAVCGGWGHSLALKADGTVWAWGYNGYGQLGTGNNNDSFVPVQVWNLSNMVSISTGKLWFGHNLSLKSDGTVWAWGYNYDGQLGDGTTEDKNIPVQVLNISGIHAISAGGDHSLALGCDGMVWAWGGNQAGQLGDGTQEESDIPVQAKGLSDVLAISAGGFHSLSILPKAIKPPIVASIKKLSDPFRLKIRGNNFNKDITVFIGDTAWDKVSYQNSETIVLKKGKILKGKFPADGMCCVSMKLLNPDGGYAVTCFKRK